MEVTEKHKYTPMRIRHEGFISMFDGNTGKYMRTGNPFMAEFPELIDVGIMETCVCSRRCKVDCYQKAVDRHGKNMSLQAFHRIMEQCQGKVFQVALGGAGDPDTHENFEEILTSCAEHNIVPNFTTSGLAMTAEKAEFCRRYCGAVAVSEHNADYTDRAVKLLLEAGVKTNIHFVLSTESIDRAIEILKTGEYRPGINAIVFLLYKPVGLGRTEKVLSAEDVRVKEFFSLVSKNKCPFKVGFDSCSCAALVNFAPELDFRFMDFCEGGRFSMYISAEEKAYPCSFANQKPVGIDISETGVTIAEAWQQFGEFRARLQNSCPTCADRENCGGGCPLLSSVILCNRKARTEQSGMLE